MEEEAPQVNFDDMSIYEDHNEPPTHEYGNEPPIRKKIKRDSKSQASNQLENLSPPPPPPVFSSDGDDDDDVFDPILDFDTSEWKTSTEFYGNECVLDPKLIELQKEKEAKIARV